MDLNLVLRKIFRNMHVASRNMHIIAIESILRLTYAKEHWVTVKIGIDGLDPDLYRNIHRINPEYVEIE